MPYNSKNRKRKIYDQNNPVNKDKKIFNQEKKNFSKKTKATYDDDLVFLKKDEKRNASKNEVNKNRISNSINSSNRNNVNKKTQSDVNNLKSKSINNVSKNVQLNKKVVVRKRLKIKNVVILILSICIILLVPIYLWAINKTDSNSNINSNNIIENNDSKDNNLVDNNLPNDTVVKNEWELLKERINFYKDEYSDRYINYKNNNPDLDVEKVVVFVNIGLDQEFYTNINSSPRQNTNLVLTNKFYSLSDKYVPNDLEVISSKYSSGERLMTHDARIAFEKMARDASLESLSIRAVSTYRSYSYQKRLYNNYVNNDGVKKADTYSARAGHSEHQTGLAVDIDNRKLSYTDFGKTKEFEWMLKNAYKYGFILRYTSDFEFITGYKNEPWHYRYVGVDIATYIYNNPMTYEEYYVRFLDK